MNEVGFLTKAASFFGDFYFVSGSDCVPDSESMLALFTNAELEINFNVFSEGSYY